jgi:hypothetical protein
MAEIGRAERALEPAIFGPEGVEHQLAVSAVGRVAVERIGLSSSRTCLPVDKVTVGQGMSEATSCSRDVARARKGRGGAGKQVLAFRREGMCFLAQDVGEIEIEARLERPSLAATKPSIFALPIASSSGRDPGCRLAERGEHVVRLGLLLLRGGDAEVLVGLEADIGIDPAGDAAEIGLGD